jgi:hypothetical protein
MKALLTSLALAFLLTDTLLAQNAQAPIPQQELPTRLPKNFTRELENAWVSVTRTHYDAHSKLPAHEHEGGIHVYLYFNASDGVVYSHGDDTGTVPRRPVQPGAMRVTDSRHEHHTVVNNAATPSDYLDILLKTETNLKVPHASARLLPGDMTYDHPFVRVARVNVAPRARTQVEAKDHPILRVAVVPGKAEWKVTATNGFRFLEKGTTEEFENSGDVPIQLVTIELKSKLVTSPK